MNWREFSLACRRIFSVDAVKESSLPHFEINERPQTFVVVLAACLVPLHDLTHEIRLENSPAERAIAQHVLVDHRTVRPAEPRSDRDRKTHLRPRQYRLGQDVL